MRGDERGGTCRPSPLGQDACARARIVSDVRVAAFLLALAAVTCGTSTAQPGRTGCCPYLQSFPQEWSANGSRLYFWSNLTAREKGVDHYDRFVVNVDGTGLAPVLPDRPDGGYLRTSDGRRVAFLADDGVLYSVDENGVERDVIASGVTSGGSLSPDGRRYAYAVAVALKVAYTSIVELPSGQKHSVGIGFNPLFSPDGSKLTVEDDDLVYVYDAETGRELFASYCCYNPERPVFSPDGTRAAFSGASVARGDDTSDLYVVDLRTGKSSEIGPGSLIDSWSPDGARIAYHGPLGVEIIRVDGTERRRFLDYASHFRFSPDWTRYAIAVEGPFYGYDLYIGVTGHGRPNRVSPSLCTVVSERCVAGGSGDDRLVGGPRRDVIVGAFGNDRIAGHGGHDLVDGQLGRDIVSGGSGRDALYGGYGNDELRGGKGSDALRGGPGADRLEGGDGRDALFGNPGSDLIAGGMGADVIFADQYADRDRITCGAGIDRVRADRTDRVAADCEHVTYRRDP